MSQLLNSYPLFEGNQVLTSTQLNQLVAYLDEQNRLTRAKLIGTGIVCGLETGLDTTVNPPLISISKGMGITSQGYLMTQGDCVLNRYVVYNLPDGASYPPFEDPSTLTQDIPLWEMITPDAVLQTGQTAKFLNDPSNFLDDKVIMLFLECVDNDLKSCLGKSCDDNGKSRVFNLRKLLVSKADVVNKIFPRTCEQTSLFDDKYSLPEIIIRRVLFEPATPQSTDYFAFSQNYINAVKGSEFVNPFGDSGNLYDQLFDALRQTYTDFAAILAPVYNGTNPFAGMPDSTWNNFLSGVSAGPKYLGSQYFYDFIKDLILAYNEFRDCAFDLMSECCMSLDCFPRHLLLGTAVPEVNDEAPSRYRHGFTTSPIFGNQNALLNKVIMLHKRMVIMTHEFNLNQINNPNITPVPPATLGVPVLITPSIEKRGVLSRRSIPYYFKVDQVDGDLGTLEENWDYEFIAKKLFAKGLAPLAYGNQNADQTIDQGPVATPLYYDTDGYNFFRIEGAIRQNYVNVTNAIEDLKKRFDLAFNVITLRLSGPPLDDISQRCDFDDLRTEYGTLRTEILSLSQNVFDRFASLSGGSVTIKQFPAFFNTLIKSTDSGDLLGSVTQPQIGVTSSVLIAEAANSAEVADGADIALRTAATTSVSVLPAATLPLFPVYAPRRTMTQAVNKLNADLTELCNKLNTLISLRLPFDLSKFVFGYTGQVPNSTDGFIQTYMSALQYAINVKVDFNQIFDLITHNTQTRLTPELYFTLGRYADEVMGLLERFITDPGYKSLTLLNYTYQYRFQYLKDNDQTLFSNFIKKNPGLEHQAGVKRGNTYVMVVPGNSVAVPPKTRNYAVQQAMELQTLITEQAILQANTARSTQQSLQLEYVNNQIINFQGIQAELAVSVPVERIAIEGTQVIADFTLPYLCCCDCECDAVGHAKEASELGIPAIAAPFYAAYNLGDYAFGGNLMTAAVKLKEGELLEIKVMDGSQFESDVYRGFSLRLYLVDRNGNRLNYKLDTSVAKEQFVDFTQMSTTNHPNDPANLIQRGTASVRVYYTGLNPTIVYRPVNGYTGVDSFYYQFEVVDQKTGAVIRNSTIGTVTVAVVGA